MSSADYWKKREQEAKKATIRDEEEYRKRIETIYKQTYEAVERQINDWYARYASKNGLSMSEARMRVKKLDMERYERLAAKYVATHDFSDQANEEMEIYNLTMRINRLELLKAQINLELLAGYDDLDKELEREFIEQAMKEDRRLAGILGDSVIGNQRYAKQIVNASFWNATYSERIWGNNMPRLRSSIETQLRNGIIQGIHSTELARNLRKSFDVSIRDSERLMITEVRRIQTEIQKDSFDRNGFKEYRFISAGDGKVCPECERLHGQHFKVSEMQPGENAPPMHPVCRCSTAAWMDGEKYKRWLDALERGEDVRWRDFEAEQTNLHEKKRRYEPLSRIYVNSEDQLYANLKKVKPYKDYEDFSVHGVPEESKIEFVTNNGVSTKYSAKEFADTLREDPSYKGGKVRLLSCGAGSKVSDFAKDLAIELGQEVLAPTETLWVGENGELFISDNEILADMWYNDGKIDNTIRQTGRWKPFAPK